MLALHELPDVIISTMSMSGYGCPYDEGTGVMHNLPCGFRSGRSKIRKNVEVLLSGKCWYNGQLL